MNDNISMRMVAACLLITTFLGCGGAEPNWQSGDSKDKAVTASFPRKPKPGKGEDDRDLTVATFRDTPIGYQTNLLVYGPGGYRFSDFFRVGAPLAVMYWLAATFLIPQLFPF